MPDEDQTEAELERTREVVAAAMAEQVAANDAAAFPDAPEGEPVRLQGEADEEGWDAYTKEELVEELRARDLPVSGSKAELVDRLNDDDKGI